jgi:alcohol dehydrogenase YqhD (iron-dependent ADH family)
MNERELRIKVNNTKVSKTFVFYILKLLYPTTKLYVYIFELYNTKANNTKVFKTFVFYILKLLYPTTKLYVYIFELYNTKANNTKVFKTFVFCVLRILYAIPKKVSCPNAPHNSSITFNSPP